MSAGPYTRNFYYNSTSNNLHTFSTLSFVSKIETRSKCVCVSPQNHFLIQSYIQSLRVSAILAKLCALAQNQKRALQQPKPRIFFYCKGAFLRYYEQDDEQRFWKMRIKKEKTKPEQILSLLFKLVSPYPIIITPPPCNIIIVVHHPTTIILLTIL